MRWMTSVGAAAVVVAFTGCAAPGTEKSALQTFVEKTTTAVADIAGTSDGKPLITKLKTGSYEPSNEAIGDERDVADRRVSHGLVTVPLLSSYAVKVLDRLKVASGVTDIPGRVLIVSNDQMDAGATPDGNIYVSLGYFRALENEDQLAALLAHELSHILLHHHDSSWLSRKQKEMMAFFEDGALLRNTLESFATPGNAAVKPLSAGQQDTLAKMNLLVKLNDRALQPAWGRRQEAEADKLAVDLMIRANYSVVEGMLPWLSKVAEFDAAQAKRRAELAVQRQATIEALASQGQVDKAVRTAVDGALQDVLEEMARSHDDGGTRLKEMDAYLTLAYSDQFPMPKSTVVPYTQVVQQRQVKATLDGYTEAFLARNQIMDRQFAKALPTLRRLTGAGSPIATHSLPNFLLYEAQRGTGGTAAGEAALKRSLAAPEPTWEPFESAADFYDGRKNRQAAITDTGRTALAKFSSAPSAYPRLIGLYVQHGLKEEAANMLAECHRTQAQMRLACDKALKK